jgi:hypothetical protein
LVPLLYRAPGFAWIAGFGAAREGERGRERERERERERAEREGEGEREREGEGEREREGEGERRSSVEYPPPSPLYPLPHSGERERCTLNPERERGGGGETFR